MRHGRRGGTAVAFGVSQLVGLYCSPLRPSGRSGAGALKSSTMSTSSRSTYCGINIGKNAAMCCDPANLRTSSISFFSTG